MPTAVQERVAVYAAQTQLPAIRSVGMPKVSLVATAIAGAPGASVQVQIRQKNTWYTVGQVVCAALNVPYYVLIETSGRQVRVQVTPGLNPTTVATLLSAMGGLPA